MYVMSNQPMLHGHANMYKNFKLQQNCDIVTVLLVKSVYGIFRECLAPTHQTIINLLQMLKLEQIPVEIKVDQLLYVWECWGLLNDPNFLEFQ